MRVHGAWGSGGAPQSRVTHFQDGQWAQMKPCMAASRSASAFALGKPREKIKLSAIIEKGSLAAARTYDHRPYLGPSAQIETHAFCQSCCGHAAIVDTGQQSEFTSTKMAVVKVTTRCMSGCLYQCAQAVSDGDRERCRSLLFEARQECIRSLASVSTESVSSVNPAILQLQQLQCVQEAWAFRWPTLSLASPPSPGLVSSASSDHALCIGGHADPSKCMGG